MGGAGGHMWHPFDCPDVNSGQDLINFFTKTIDYLRVNPAALKIDGVNLSFRLRENPKTSTGFEFVVDRGSMKDLDVQGVTAGNANQRFVSKDGSPHGMVEATKILLGIFNNSLPEILPELQELKMTDSPGHFGLYFNTEFVLKKINVKEYPFNFIAIHGVNKFVPKGPKSRKGINVEFEQGLLDSIRDKVERFANEQDFKTFTKIPASLSRNVRLDDALNQEFTIVYKTYTRDEEEEGELGAGEGATKPLKVWLNEVQRNPVNETVRISPYMRQKYKSMGAKQTPFAKNIYLEVLQGTAIYDIASTAEDVEEIVDAVVLMHATRILGNAVLDALDSEEFGSARDQEGVVVQNQEICGGTPFKFTGDFIVGGLASTFEEAKFKKGNLIKEFQELPDDKDYVILIPGGFKPPTGGHYHMIKHYEKIPQIRKVFVVTGPKPREGVTIEQSKQIFDIYGGFSDKVEFITAPDKTPLTTCYELVKNSDFTNQFPNASFSIGASNKGGDQKRIEQFVKYFADRPHLTDSTVAEYPAAPALEAGGGAASASRMRKAYRDQDWETFKLMLPDDNYYDDVVQVLLQGGGLQENFLNLPSLFSLVEEVLNEDKQDRISKKIAHLIGDEGKSKEQAAAIAYSMEERGELSEEAGAWSGAQSGGKEDSELRARLKPLVRKILGDSADLFAGVDARVGQLDLDTEILEPLSITLTDQLFNIVKNKTKSPEEQAAAINNNTEQLEEMSAMGAGAVEGGGGSPWINLRSEEDEK